MRSDPDKRLQDRNAIRLKPHLDKDHPTHHTAQTLGDATSIPVNRVYVPEKFQLSITQRPAALNRGMRTLRTRNKSFLIKFTIAIIVLTPIVYYLVTTGF